MEHLWPTIDRLVQWLDAETDTTPEVARLLRVLKISEEAGEVAEAIHGVCRANPRKGAGHTWEDVQNELCDVILTSMVALRTITPDAEQVFAARLDHVAERSLGSRPTRCGVRETAPSSEGDQGGDRQVVTAGGEQGADVADGRRAGHDQIDPGHREGGGEAEGEATLRHVQL